MVFAGCDRPLQGALQRLGYFESGSVEVETVPVAGSNDQVDLVFSVVETTSGSFTFGLGYSQLSGLTTSLQLTQNNFLGTGNRISVEAQRNVYLQRYSFSFLNPYFTDEGLSLGYNLWWREFDNSEFNTAHTRRPAPRLRRARLPITEYDTVSAGFCIDRTRSSRTRDPRRSRSSTTSMSSAIALFMHGA